MSRPQIWPHLRFHGQFCDRRSEPNSNTLTSAMWDASLTVCTSGQQTVDYPSGAVGGAAADKCVQVTCLFEFRPAARIGPAFLSRLFIVLMDAMINGLSMDLRGDGLTRKRVCV